jgi:hypothetical protein
VLAEVLRSYKQAYLFHVSLLYSLVFVLYVHTSIVLDVMKRLTHSKKKNISQPPKLFRPRNDFPQFPRWSVVWSHSRYTSGCICTFAHTIRSISWLYPCKHRRTNRFWFFWCFFFFLLVCLVNSCLHAVLREPTF